MRSVGKRKQIKKKVAPKHHKLPAGRVQKARHPLIALAILFGSIFVLVSGLWIISSSGLVTNRFKPQFETGLSEALNRQVTIGRLEGGLFDRVVLRNINLSTRQTHPESLDISIQRVVVQYSLWDILIRKKPLADSLHHIQLIHPLIRIERSTDGHWRTPQLVTAPLSQMTAGPGAPKLLFPKIRVSLVAGEIKMTDGIHTASIKKLKGLLNLKDPTSTRLYLSGRTGRGRRQNLKVSGIMDLTDNTMKMGLKANRIEIAPLERVARISEYFNIQKGQADLELKIRSRAPTSHDLISGFGIEGKMVLYDATLQSQLVEEPLQNIFGIAYLNDKNITLKNMQAILANTTWTATGEVTNVQKPVMNIRVKSSALELSELASRLPNLSSLEPEGRGEATILIKGEVPDLTVTANFRMPKGKIGKLKIRKFEVITRYRDRELRLMLARGIFARGWIEGRGRILLPENGEGKPHLSFRGDAKELQLKDMISLFGVSTVAGKVSGMLTVEGPLEKPTLYGKLTSPRIKISDTQLDRIKGELEYNDDSIRLNLNTDWGVLRAAQFNIESQRKQAGWSLTRFLVTQGKRELLRAYGSWNLNGNDVLHGSLATQQLPIQLIPMLPEGTKHLNGTIDFSGKVSGTTKLPLLQGTFSTDKLVSHVSGKIDARGDIHISSKKMELDNVWLDRKRIGLTGRIIYGEKAQLHSDVKMKRLPLKHLMVLGGVEDVRKLGGTITGAIEADGLIKQLKCKGDIQLRNPRWFALKGKTGTLKFSTNGRRVWVKEMELVQSRGKFNGVLETELGQNEGPFQILTWMDSFEINKRRYTGELKIKGTASGTVSKPHYSAQLDLENLEVDKQKFPQASGRVSFHARRLTVEELRWGEDLTFTGETVFGKKTSAKLQMIFNQSNFKSVRQWFAPERQTLEERVSGTLNLKMNDKTIDANLRVLNGKDKIQGEFEATVNASGIDRFLGRLQIENFQTPLLFDLFLLSPPDQSPQGKIAGRVLFDGKKGTLDRLDGDLTFSDFKFGEWKFITLKTGLEKRGSQWTLKHLEGKQARGSLKAKRGNMQENTNGSYQLSLDLLTDNFYFFTRKYHGNFAVNGSLVLKPTYDLKLDVLSSDFQLDLHPFGEFHAMVHNWEDKLTIRTPATRPVQIAADFQFPPDGAIVFNRLSIYDRRQVYIETKGHVGGAEISDLFIKVKNVKADLLAQCLGWPQPWAGTVNGSFHLTDPDKLLRFDINVKIENGSVMELPFDVFQGNIVIDHHWLYFRGQQGYSVLTRHGYYTMNLSGKIPVPLDNEAAEQLKGEEMDVRVHMPDGDFSYINFIPHFVNAKGKSMLDLHVKGTAEYPSLYGRAKVENGTLYPRVYTPKIEKLNADIVFEDNRVYINQLEGFIGGGKLELTAGPHADWATIFRRLQPHELNLKLDTRKGPIKTGNTDDYEFMEAKVAMDATLAGTYEEPILGGVFEVSDGQFTFPPRTLTPFSKKLKTSNMSYNNFKTVTKNNLWFYNDVVRALMKQEQSVVFNGGKHDFAAEGQVLIERGSFTYLETDFSLNANEETVVDFQNQAKPHLNSLAETTIRDVEIKDEGRSRDATIYLQVRGMLGELKIKLYSDPDMTQAQIVSLLTLGEDYSSWSQEEIDQKVQNAGARVLGRLAGNLIGREIEKSIKRITPLDVIDVRLGGVEKLADSIMSGSGNTGSAEAGTTDDITGTSLLDETQIDVGKYLTNDLFLNYRGTLKDKGTDNGGLSWESSVGLEYNLDASKKIKIYKNFDADSDQELFWGIEGRVKFEGWSPEQALEENEQVNSPVKTPTATKK